MYSRISSAQRACGLGDPPAVRAASPARSGRAMRQIQCSATQLERVNEILGKKSSAAEMQTLLQQAVDDAANLGRGGAVPIAGQRAALFEAVFGVPASWHPAGAPWVLGGVVRKRMALAAKLLSSGSVWISCFGWPWPDPSPDTPETYVLRATGGKYRIGLGRKFWDAVRDRDSASVDSALLAAALRIYFGNLIRFSPGARPKNLSYCYMRYALYVAGRQIPAWIGAGCPIPPSRWNRLMPSPPAGPAPAPAPDAPTPAPPPRLRLTDEELERILGGKPTDPLSAHIDWIISQVPPTAAARPTLGEQLKRKLGECIDRVSSRLGVPQRYRKYVRQVAEGATKKGSKLVVEEGLRRMGLDSAEAIEAVWGTVERMTQESP